VIRLDSEDTLSLRDAVGYLKSRGITVGRTTIYRWAGETGFKGVRLETIQVAGMKYTSRQAIQRFVERTTEVGSC